ncbi:MAG TPA: alpha/beta hydrolase [Longimicrobium sp.]|nr:alpha/beta hydrolase [Longimicrobium sp.]
MGRLRILVLVLCAACASGARTEPGAGSLPAMAAVRDTFATVNGVRLHYRDWGGSGEPVLLLAGLGNTARVYDGFAPELARDFRVLAITRRGSGRSEIPASGYGLDTLVADIRAFMDAAGIQRAHLVGHSLAGAELTRFAALHPERVGKLVYLDAAYDRSTQGPVSAQDPRDRSGPTPADRASVEAYLAFTRRTRLDLARYWTAPMVADVTENLAAQADGTVAWRTPGPIYGAILGGVNTAAPEYDRVRAPALAVYSVEREDYWVPANATAELRAAHARFQAEVRGPWRRQSMEQFRSGVRDGRVVEMDAGHHLFLHQPAEVLQLVRDFLRQP